MNKHFLMAIFWGAIWLYMIRRSGIGWGDGFPLFWSTMGLSYNLTMWSQLPLSNQQRRKEISHENKP